MLPAKRKCNFCSKASQPIDAWVKATVLILISGIQYKIPRTELPSRHIHSCSAFCSASVQKQQFNHTIRIRLLKSIVGKERVRKKMQTLLERDSTRVPASFVWFISTVQPNQRATVRYAESKEKETTIEKEKWTKLVCNAIALSMRAIFRFDRVLCVIFFQWLPSLLSPSLHVYRFHLAAFTLHLTLFVPLKCYMRFLNNIK